MARHLLLRVGARLKPSRSKAEARQSAASTDWRRVFCVLLFAASGCSALIYEIVWFQLLGLVVGSTAISLGILLASFMGGLGLGSVLLSRLVDVSRNPFRIYALLELGIGVFGLIELLLIPTVQGLYSNLNVHGPVAVVIRAAIAGICLLPPTVMMGAALPAVARYVESTPQGATWLGVLYTSNIVGGIGGSLWAGFYLLRFGDVAQASIVAAVLNGLVAAGAALTALGVRLPPPEKFAHAARLCDWPVLLIAALSGFCALGAEVVWTRVLALLLGATVYTFSIVLAVFLIGLAAGSAVGAALARRFPQHAVALCQALLVPAVLWGALALTRSLPYWPIAPSLALSPWISFQLDLARAMWAIFPAALLWGASFPLCLAAAADTGGDPGRLVGRVYAANTIGSIIGALLFSLLLVPVLGTGHSQQVIALVASLSAITLPVADLARRRGRAVTGWLLAAGVVSVVIALAIPVPSIPAGLVAYGRSMAYRLGAWNARTNSRFSPDLLYVGEGINESVAVSEEGGVRLFHVSGKTEASTTLRDMRLQRMLGHLPALIHPEPRSVLIVGFGAGVTSGTFVLYPTIQRIVICELEPLIPQKVAPYFQAENYGVVSDPRVQIVYDDARHFLLTTKEKFDIITSDPIHPWVKGSAALYSSDYFQLVRRHLNRGGAVSQWVPLYQASEVTIKSEVATFFSAFPEGSVWANNERGQGYDLVLVGTAGPTSIDLDATAARLEQPSYARVDSSLKAVGFSSLPELLSTYVTRQQDLAPWLTGAQINRDWKPWLQYQAGLESYTEQEADIYSGMAQYRVFPKDIFRGSPQLQQAIMSAGDPSAQQ